MGMIAADEHEKFRLASEICDVSARAIACAKFHHPHTRKTPFINWYLVLRVNENADVYGIRKQYHKLALQLHPDKNKHSKAETAFKLVSEAYFCLSDGAKRAAFDSERHNTSCTKCNNNNTIPNTNTEPLNQKTRTHSQEATRLSRLQKRMHELRNKLRDEADIIEKCLIANATRQEAKNAGGAKRELPVFNPSDYYQHKGSPQSRVIDHKVMEDLWTGFRIGSRCINDRAMNSSPVFQYQSGRSFMSRCATTRDR